MTPKEKAEDLVKKCFSVDFEDGQEKYFAKLIVDEILSNGGNYHGMSFGDNEMWIDIQFWESVKDEINKL